MKKHDRTARNMGVARPDGPALAGRDLDVTTAVLRGIDHARQSARTYTATGIPDLDMRTIGKTPITAHTGDVDPALIAAALAAFDAAYDGLTAPAAAPESSEFTEYARGYWDGYRARDAEVDERHRQAAAESLRCLTNRPRRLGRLGPVSPVLSPAECLNSWGLDAPAATADPREGIAA